jgi:hypothetical protein
MSQGKMVHSRAWRDVIGSHIIGAMIEDIGEMTLPHGEGAAIAIDFIPQRGGYHRLLIKHKNDTVFDVEVVDLMLSEKTEELSKVDHEES